MDIARRRSSRALLVIVFIAYCAVVITGACVHEPWWDEAQSWLIARDAPLGDLFTHVLRYEGHPPLWFLILAIPAKLGAPYWSMKVVAALIGMITAALLLFAFPRVPLVVRVIVPFAFFFAYQWTVVARSYVLLPPLLLAIVRMYDRRAERPGLFALLLILLSNVSVYGLAIACVLALLFVIEHRRFGWAGAAFAINVVVLAILLWPPPDRVLRSLMWRPFSPARHAQVVSTIVPSLFFNALENESPMRAVALVAIALVALTILIAWIFRSGAGAPFALATLAAYAIALRYFSEWHEGIFFLLLLAFAYLAFERRAAPSRLDAAAFIVIVALLLRHGYWTARSLAYDVAHPITGSTAAAQFLASHSLDRQRVFGLGQSVIELQPYFEKSLFANDPLPAYWDWSPRNTWPYVQSGVEDREEMSRWYARQLAAAPDVIVVGSGVSVDELYLRPLRADRAYSEIASFEGTLFWKDRGKWTSAFRIFERRK